MQQTGALVPLKQTHNQVQFTVPKMKNALFKCLTAAPTQMIRLHLLAQSLPLIPGVMNCI